MHFTFSPDSEYRPACRSGQAGIAFALSDDPGFQNRDYRFWQDSFLFDGYSHWFRGQPDCLPESECFTVSAAFLPLTYSSHGDGLFSYFNEKACKGLEILLNKGGIITVNLGTGHSCIRFCSLRAHVHSGKRNVVTVVYRGDAGWCDLYVNGVLSNRKQFRRRTPLSFPKGHPYIGRRTDEGLYKEGMPFGCFYGFMQWIDIEPAATSEAEILSLHRSVYTGKQEPEAFALGMPQRSTYHNDRNRPVYHLSPTGKWMNEPHGPLFYNGWYHIFYQGNPHAPIWDHLCWGHLRSKDMVHWQSCPPALIPEKEAPAPDGCWSGSSVIDKDGKPRIYFTAGNDGNFPNQAVALAAPADCTDDALTVWQTREDLIQEQDMGWMGEFRDPFVWLENGSYYMLVGSGDGNNGGGNAILYSSDDGLSWQNHGFVVDYDFANNSEVGHVWELPVLLPLKDESGNTVCHILLLCAAQVENEIVETYYFLGSWDEQAKTFTKHHDKARLLDLGKGIFTGPSGFVTPDGRTVVFTIAQGQRRFMDEVHAGWAHNGGLPVELSIRKGALNIQPIRELEALRKEEISVHSVEDLAQHSGDALCLEYSAEGDNAAVTLHFGEKFRQVAYDRFAKRLGIQDENGQEIGRWRCETDDVDIGTEDIHFLCYLDHSMLEIYLNGRKAVSLRNYTESTRYFQVTGTPKKIRLWKMDSAYEEDGQ